MNDIKESVLSTVATVDAPLDKITIIGIAVERAPARPLS